MSVLSVAGPTGPSPQVAVPTRGPSSMLIAAVAILAMVASVLGVQPPTVLESIGEALPSRSITEPSPADVAALEQLATVGEGVVLPGATASLDGRFMLAGPVFEADSARTFAVATSTIQGETVAAVEPVLSGDTVTYTRGDVTEWWVRDGRAHEQGWTFASAPADGATTLTVGVEFAGASPLLIDDSTVQLLLADGSTAWYRNLVAFDADGVDLPAVMTVDGSTVRIEVDAAGATYPVTIDPIIDADQDIRQPSHTTGDLFGEAVATDGSLLVVSARGADQQGPDEGLASLFEWNGADWDRITGLGNTRDVNIDFAWDVDVNETAQIAVVGAPGDDENGVDAGAVFVYAPDPGDGLWRLQQILYECNAGGGTCGDAAQGGFDGSEFGKSVAVADSGRIVVGAPGAEGGEGRGYVYEPGASFGDPWLREDGDVLTAAAVATPQTVDRLGESIDISSDGTYVITGSPGDPFVAASDSGSVQLHVLDGAAWKAIDQDQGPSGAVGQEFGSAVSIDQASNGDWIVVAGRPFRSREDQGDSGTGGVRVYRLTGAPGAEQLATVGLGDITAPIADDGMGFSVAFDGESDQVIVGAPFESGGGNPERGIVRVYQYDAVEVSMDNGGAGASAAELDLPTAWPTAAGLDRYGFGVAAGPPGVDETYVAGSPGFVRNDQRRSPSSGRITTTGPNFASLFTTKQTSTAAAFDLFGYSVAISGNRMAVGATGDDQDQPLNGLVYTYERASATDPWTLDQLIVDPTETDDAKPFGASIDLEGNYLAIGSPGGAGGVAVYEHNGTSWSTRAYLVGDLADNSTGNLDFGYDVAITSDGSLLAVGIPGHDNACGALDCGAVEIFEWNAGGPSYDSIGILSKSNGEEDNQFLGYSVDIDQGTEAAEGGVPVWRVVAGSATDTNSISLNTWTRSFGAPSFAPFTFESDLPAQASIAVGESVAMDGDRIVAASLSGLNDQLVVFDLNGPGEWADRVIFEGLLFNGSSVTPNNQLDVSGDTIAIGRSDGFGGEVGVFYNDPAFGWGLADTNAGWTNGPVDRIQPAGRVAGDGIGFSVAVDGGTTKTILAGAPSTGGGFDDVGQVYSTNFTEAGTPEPDNKLTVDTFGSGLFGSAISILDLGAPFPPFALVSEPGSNRAHFLEFDGTSWTIKQTFDFDNPVVDVDFGDSGAVVLEDSGLVSIFNLGCVGGVPPSCSLSRSAVTGNFIGTTATSIVVTSNDEIVVAGPSGDEISQIPIADGSNLPTFGPGLVPADEFGDSMDASGTIVAIGAPGVDGGDGRVYLYDAQNLSFIETIDSPLGPGSAGRFGDSVALDGDTLVVGTPDFQPGGGVDGSFVIMDISGPTATVVDTPSINAGSGLSGWGFSVDIDGDVIVVGGTGYEESGVAFRDGSAVAFGLDGGTWVQTDQFDHTDDAAADQAGFAVAVAGTNVLVGARLDDNPQGENAGAVYAYEATPIVAPPVLDDPQLTFSIGLDAGSPASVTVAPSGIAVGAFSQQLLEDAAENDSTVAAAPLAATDLDATPLAAVPLAATPLAALALDPTSTISSIPIIEIGLDEDGGWPALFESTGSALADVPINDITFGDVAADPNAGFAGGAGSLASTPLAAVDVNGTPLAAIPLAAVVLGELTLDEIPGPDWCTILTPYVSGGCGTIGAITLMEASVSGVPLAALPLAAVPLAAVDFQATPLAAVPLAAVDLEASPLAAVPLAAVPLAAVGLDSTPLAAVPLAAVPLAAVDLNGTPLAATPLAAVPLAALELQNVPLAATPLAAVDVGSLPLAAVTLAAVAYADVALADIPPSALEPGSGDWCQILEDINAGYDCSNGVSEASFLASTTIADLGVNGVPLAAVPLAAVPLAAVPLAAVPLAAVPLAAVPLAAVPVGGLPLAAVDITGTPLAAVAGGSTLASVPLAAVDIVGSPLAAVPLAAVDVAALDIGTTPLAAVPLAAVPLAAVPLAAVTLDGTAIENLPLAAVDVLSSPLAAVPLAAVPLAAVGNVDCDLVDCEIDTIGDAIRVGALDPNQLTLGELGDARAGIGLGDLEFFTNESIEDALAGAGLTLGDLTDLDDLTLGDLPNDLPQLADDTLGDLEAALYNVNFADLINAFQTAPGSPIDGAAVEPLLRAFVDNYTFADLTVYGDVTLGTFLEDGADASITFGQLGTIFDLIHSTDTTGFSINPGASDLGDLAAQGLLADLTLADLIGTAELDAVQLATLLNELGDAGLLEGFTLGDVLVTLVDPGEIPFSDLDFTEVESSELPTGTVPPVTFASTFEVTNTVLNRTVEVVVQLPATASYAPTSGLLVGPRPVEAEPVIDGNTLTWTFGAIAPDLEYTLTFDVVPTVSLGSTTLDATGRVLGTPQSISAISAVEVAEGLEPNDFPATTALSPDTIYLTYISSESDNDVFDITVSDNDQLAIQLSGLAADFDFAVYGRPADGNVNAALTDTSDNAPIEPILDPDQTGANSEPLDDFRRLDQEDGTLEFIGLSNAPGTEVEQLLTDPLPAGTYVIQVFGANGATSIEPAALQVQRITGDARPPCAAEGAITGAVGTAPSLAGSTANTVFIVNEQRIRHFHGQAGLDELNTAMADFVDYLTVDNPALGIDPIVVPVDGIGAVQAAYAAWDTDGSCSPESANAVVAAIVDQVIDPLRGSLENVVIVGGDPIVPMARLLDATEIANEYDFRHEFIGDNIVGGNANAINALTASFWDRQYLSDEPYGEAAAQDLGNRYLYVSDLALGRLVETPTEIAGQLAHFETFNGSLEANTAAVLGYDFLVDSSEEIAADLAAAGLTVDDELADGLDAGGAKWDRNDAQAKLIGGAGGADLISLNAHFDHYRALPADGDQVPNFTNNLLADTIAASPGSLIGSIIFSMGCHGGLNVSDQQIGDGPDNTNGDWAQTFAADQAIFIGNTGFGYGDTEAVAYTERLMALFAENAVRPVLLPDGLQTTIGQALTFAKNTYAADLSTFSVYDEKALMESTFYGLPFYRVGATPVPAPPAPETTTVPDATGIETFTVNATPANTPATTDRGTIWSNPDANGDPQTIVAPARPIQPSESFEISVVDDADTTNLAQVAHGALVLDMVSTYQSPVDPVIAAVTFNESEDSPEPPIGDQVFPAKPVTINSSTTVGGERQTLVLATGQFDSFGSVQRLDSELDVVVYYDTPNESDFVDPTIGAVESILTGGTLTVSTSVTDAAAVRRVYMLVGENPGTGTVDWKGLDLQNDPGTDEWSGSIQVAAGTTEVEFLLQAVDANGNVGYATNKARNFEDDVVSEPPPPAPDLDVTVSNANLDGGSGWYTGSVTVTVDSGDLDATYVVLPGGDPAPVPAGGSFTITDEGVNRWEVTRADGQKEVGEVRIDTLNPTVTLAPPANGATYTVSEVPGVGFTCLDTSLQTCVATADGQSISNGDALPDGLGSHSVSVTATDALGNQASASATYTVIADPVDNPPSVTISTPNDGAEFTVGAVPDIAFSCSDQNLASCTATVNGTPIADGDPLPGTVGSYTVEVTGVDAGGQQTTETATYTVVDDDPGPALVIEEIAVEGVALVGEEVAVEGEFTGGTAPYSVSIDWGDGTSCPGDGSCSVTAPSDDDPGVLEGALVYPTAGVYEITVTITDSTGASVSETLTTATCTITGTNRRDVLAGTNGDDVICGRGGNDRIFGNGGDDIIFGGAGRDEIQGGNGDDVIFGGRGNDTIVGGNGDDVISGGRGTDVIRGGNGDDVLRGRRGNDQLYGDDGDDLLYGNRNDDRLWGGDGADELFGGSGDDQLRGEPGDDLLVGGAGADLALGNRGDDEIFGSGGNDDLRGGNDDDTIDGGAGTDRCRGNSGSDTLVACET